MGVGVGVQTSQSCHHGYIWCLVIICMLCVLCVCVCVWYVSCVCVCDVSCVGCAHLFVL